MCFFCYSILNDLQGLCYLDLLEGLDEVAFYDVVVALDAQTALHVETCLLDIVFTMLERREFASMDHNTVTDYAAFVSTFGFTLTHDTTCDRTHLGDTESLQYLEGSRNLLLDLWREHTCHSRLDLVDGIVDDGVDTDIHLLVLCHLTRCASRTHIEADDNSVGRSSQQDIRVRDSTHSTMDDIDLDDDDTDSGTDTDFNTDTDFERYDIKELEHLLREAIEVEDYAKASVLRDIINDKKQRQ